MIISQGTRLLRVSLQTAGNFGYSQGTAAVDAPVALDPWSTLPFIPDSIIKGVIAGAAFGDVESTRGINRRREALFGSPDDNKDGKEFTPGKRAAVTFGDGELLCFALAGRDGTPVYVFAARTLWWIARLPLSRALTLDVPSLDAELCVGDVPASKLPDGVASLRPHRLGNGDPRALAGLGADQPMLIAGDAVVARLWRAAVETRHQTRIDTPTKQVAAQSLRTVERVPPGAVFVSLVTNAAAGDARLDLPQQLQFGGWEAIGAGFVSLDWVDESGQPLQAEEVRETCATPSSAQLMVAAYEAVAACASEPFANAARSVIREFAMRLRQQGAPATFAFSLGKAKCRKSLHDNPSVEAQTHRWLLRALFPAAAQVPLQEPQGELLAQVTALIGGDQSPPPRMEERLGWLARYADTMIAP